MFDEHAVVAAANHFNQVLCDAIPLDQLDIDEVRGLFVAMTDIMAVVVVSGSAETEPFIALLRAKIDELRLSVAELPVRERLQ